MAMALKKKLRNIIKAPLVFIAVIMFLAFLVRTAGIIENNILFLFDGARDFLFVKKIVIDHHLALIGPESGGLQGYFHGVLWYYLLAVPFALSGGNPASGTWFMAFMSTFSVILAFFILRKTMNIYAGIIGAVLLTVGEYSIATSKFIWNPYPIVWLMPLYFFGVFLIVKKSKWGIILLSLIQGLIIHFEIIYGLGILPAYFILIFVYLREAFSDRLKFVIISFFILVLPLTPNMLFDLRHNFLISNSVFGTIQSGGANISHRSDEIPNEFRKRLALRLDDLTKYTFRSLTRSSSINYLSLTVLIFGLIYIKKKKINKEIFKISVLSLLIIISPFFVFLLLKYNVWGYYWIGNAALYATLVAFIAGYFTQQYIKNTRFLILAVAFLLITYPWGSLLGWRQGDLKPGRDVLSTQLEVVKTIYEDAGGEKFSVYQHTPPVYDYVYRYLFWWKGSNTYGYVPANNKQKIVYVILDGVPEDPNGEYFVKNVLHLETKSIKTFKFDTQWPKLQKFINKDEEQGVDPNFFPNL